MQDRNTENLVKQSPRILSGLNHLANQPYQRITDTFLPQYHHLYHLFYQSLCHTIILTLSLTLILTLALALILTLALALALTLTSLPQL